MERTGNTRLSSGQHSVLLILVKRSACVLLFVIELYIIRNPAPTFMLRQHKANQSHFDIHGTLACVGLSALPFFLQSCALVLNNFFRRDLTQETISKILV